MLTFEDPGLLSDTTVQTPSFIALQNDKDAEKCNSSYFFYLRVYTTRGLEGQSCISNQRTVSRVIDEDVVAFRRRWVGGKS